MLSIAGPCGDWPLDETICDDWASMPAVTGHAATIAVNNLWALTGRRLGTCQATIRPCAKADPYFTSTYNSGGTFPPGAAHTLPGTAFSILAIDGTRSNILAACGDCFDSGRAELHLPFRNVVSVDDVTIEGTPVATGAGESTFAIFDNNIVVWQHAGADHLFPNYQDLTRPLGENKTWSITVTYGIPLPSDAAAITGLYACELAKALSDRKCALPRKLDTLSRQGVTMTFVNSDYLSQGLVGHPDVDQWIVRLNPYRQTQPSQVFSPESIRDRPRTRTG